MRGIYTDAGVLLMLHAIKGAAGLHLSVRVLVLAAVHTRSPCVAPAAAVCHRHAKELTVMDTWSKRGLWLLVTLLCIAVAAFVAYSLPFFSIVMVSQTG